MRLSVALRSLLAVTICAPLAAAAPQGIGGAVLGYAPDPGAMAVRLILGMPGAAVLGDPIPLPSGTVRVFAPPRGGYLVLVTSNAVSVAGLSLSTGEVNISNLDSVPPAADFAAFSPDGREVALYDASAAAVRVVTGLPDAAKLDRTIDVSVLSGTVRSLALASDGTLALGAADDQSGSVFLFDTAGVPSLGASVRQSRRACVSTRHRRSTRRRRNSKPHHPCAWHRPAGYNPSRGAG